MTRDELVALCASAPEVVVALVEQLVAQVAVLQAQGVTQAGELARLQARVKELEDRLATDSHNSSKPPSSDPGIRRTRSLREPSGRKPGGQPGHPGTTLRLVETPDRVMRSSPEQCPGCGAALGAVPATAIERRQVVEVPPLKLEVVEYQVEVKQCPCCGAETKGTFPAGVSEPVQYGERMQALGVYLHVYHLLPDGRTSELLADLFGAGLSPGTVDTAMQRCAAGLVKTEAAIKKGLRAAAVAHFDETGCRVEGKRYWLHVASTATLTHYGWHRKRGKEAIDAIDILPKFGGRAIHDGLPLYLKYPCLHGLCNAHHLRELTFLEEQQQQVWAGEMKTLLRAIKGRVAEVQAAGGTQLDAATRQAFAARYQEVLDAGFAVNPDVEERSPPGKRGPKKQSKAKNLLDRLSSQREAVLAFMADFRVPFDNNLAERDLRMVKVQQKVSGCFRSDDGATAFCRTRSYISTVRKQGHPVLTALEHVFAGTPFVPNLQAE